MLRENGTTLMEIIVVLIIVGIAAAFVMPNYTVSMEQSRAANARNNLLAIYSAEQNYKNNSSNGSYCLSGANSATTACTTATDTTCADSLAQINCNLSLGIQDDGTYTYACALSGTSYICTATRTSIAASNTIVLTLNAPVQLSSGTLNPACNLTASWCP